MQYQELILTLPCLGSSSSSHVPAQGRADLDVLGISGCRLVASPSRTSSFFFACSSISLDIHCEKNISMADAGICCLQRLGSSELHSFLLAGTLCNAHNLLDCPDQNCSLGSACSLFQIMTQSDSDQNCSLRRMHFHVMRHVIPPSGLH